MIIESKGNGLVKFGSLNEKDVFTFDGLVWMKMRPISNDERWFNVVCLDTAVASRMTCDTIVLPKPHAVLLVDGK